MSTQERDIVRYYILFSGRVQGVGFRWQVMMLAEKMELSGTVKNRDDGQVEAYLQGPKEKILDAVQKIRSLGPYVRVDDYQMKEVPVTKDRGFEVIY